MKYSEAAALAAEMDRMATTLKVSLPFGEELFWGDGRPYRLTWHCGLIPPGPPWALGASSVETHVILDGPCHGSGPLDSCPMAVLRRYMEIREQIERWKKNEASWPQARPVCGKEIRSQDGSTVAVDQCPSRHWPRPLMQPGSLLTFVHASAL